MKSNCPIVPYTNPFVGSTLEYRRDPRAFVEKYSAVYGPVFQCHIFGRVNIILFIFFLKLTKKKKKRREKELHGSKIIYYTLSLLIP